MDPVGQNSFGMAVALATSSLFGVGGARFHYSSEEEWVDTVYLGAWPRAIFDALGGFDEEQIRNQDDEFNYRLRERGGKVLLTPRIRSQYFNRGTLASLWSDRIVESDQPLFPGYFFCRVDPKKRLPILTTPNVVSIVGFASEPAPVPDSEVKAVQAILRSGLATEPCPFLREGQAVRVRRGALEGLEGILIKKNSEWRMVVSVTMLHRSLSVEIDREWIATI